jgi:hypothetical protein
MKYEGPFQEAARKYLESKGHIPKPVPRYTNKGMNPKNYCIPDGCFEDSEKNTHLLDAKDDKDTTRDLQVGVGQWMYNQEQCDYSWGAVAEKHVPEVIRLCKKYGIGLISIDELMNAKQILEPKKIIKKKAVKPKNLVYARDLNCDRLGECLELINKINSSNKSSFVKRYKTKINKQYATLKNIENYRSKTNFGILINGLKLRDEGGALNDKGKSLLRAYQKDLEEEKNENKDKSS